MLALSGSLDMRTPTSLARSVVAQFPHGRLLVVTGAGHYVLTLARTPCLVDAVHHWLGGAATPGNCAPPAEPAPLPV